MSLVMFLWSHVVDDNFFGNLRSGVRVRGEIEYC
jgi:hypothetical protein